MTPIGRAAPTFAERTTAALRLVVLQVLAAAAAEGVADVNDSILRSAVCEFGPRPELGALNQALDWLAAERLLTLREAGEFRIAALTELGADVAAGRVTVPGVRQPDLPAHA